MMLLEDAKDSIARMIRDALQGEGGTQPIPAPGINFFGGSNVVQIHVGAPLPAAAPPSALQPIPTEPTSVSHPAFAARRRGVLLQMIARRERELGKPDLSLRFFKSLYNTTDVRRLDAAQLERALQWLEEHET